MGSLSRCTILEIFGILKFDLVVTALWKFRACLLVGMQRKLVFYVISIKSSRRMPLTVLQLQPHFCRLDDYVEKYEHNFEGFLQMGGYVLNKL